MIVNLMKFGDKGETGKKEKKGFEKRIDDISREGMIESAGPASRRIKNS